MKDTSINAAAITFENFENTAKEDIAELLKMPQNKIKAAKTVLLFDADDNGLSLLSLHSQPFYRIMRLFFTAEISDNYDITKNIIAKAVNKNKALIKSYINGSSFKVKTKRINSFTKINSQIISQIIGEEILNNIDAKVKMKNYSFLVFAYAIGNKLYLGIDFSGFNLTKRSYKIFSSQNSLNSSFAYLLFKLGFSELKYKANFSMLDPFCRTGEIPIEAALFLNSKFIQTRDKAKFLFNNLLSSGNKMIKQNKENTPGIKDAKIFAFDSSLHNIISSKKNAKIASVYDDIEFSKSGLEWLDTRLGEKSVSLITTQLPVSGKTMPIADVQKQYKELFYQADYILKDNGLIVLAMTKDTAFLTSDMGNFKIAKRFETFQGKQKFFVYIVKRK